MLKENLELRKFIFENENWESLLQEKPYSLTIKRDCGYILFKYNQIESDFSLKIVQESRGIILDEVENFKTVCRPFFKFFNYGETQAADIDWDSAKIESKVDGSILKVWFSDRLNSWIVSTNGVILGEEVPIMFPSDNVKTFGDMINTTPRLYWEFNNFNKDYTYIFEIVGPQNRVVVPYKEIDMYFLSAFNNDTGVENRFEEEIVGFPRPKRYSFNSLEETISFTEDESFNTYTNEGFVVSDKYSNRIKIKTKTYLYLHRLRGENSPTTKRFLELIRENEQEEFLTYFPEYVEMFNEVKRKYISFRNELDKLIDYFHTINNLERKEFAFKAKETVAPSFMFGLLDGKYETPIDYIHSLQIKKLEEIIEKY